MSPPRRRPTEEEYKHPKCADCEVLVRDIGEYAYMVTSKIWASALLRHRRYGGQGSTYDLLCIGCLETRLGRQLVPADFQPCLLNTSRDFDRSTRLRSRMRGQARQQGA